MLQKIIILTLVLSVGFATQFVLAQDAGAPSYRTELLARVGDTGMLPTNPLYFIKEFGRGIRRLFIFDPVKQAEYELMITDEKAAELSEVENNDPDDKNAIDKAMKNYEENIDRLGDNLQDIKGAEDNTDTEKLISELEEKLRTHKELFEDLSKKYEEAMEEIENLRTRIDELLEVKDELKNDSPDTGKDTGAEPSSGNKVCQPGYVLETDNDGRQKCFPKEPNSPEINYFRAIDIKGGNTTAIYEFSWSSSNTSYCEISDKGNYFPINNKYSASGSVKKDLFNLNLGTFHLYCYNSSGESDHEYVTVERSKALSPEINYFRAEPVKSGSERYIFSWDSDNTSYCEITDKGSGFFSEKSWGPSGSTERTLTGLNLGTFHIYCYAQSGAYAHDYVTVEVERSKPQINYFKATLMKGGPGGYVFSWDSSNTSYCKITDKGGDFFLGKSREPSGSVEKILTGLSLGTFHIYCYASDGTYAHDYITVEVGE